MPVEKLSLDITPSLPSAIPELQALRDSIELNNRKLEFYINLAQQTADAAIPVGGIIGLETTTAPVGYFLCNGGSFSGVDYPELATYLGGTTLPDYRGRVLVGRDAGQTEFDILGEVGGSKTSTALHTHNLAGHTHSGTTAGDVPNHTHGMANHGHTVNGHNHGGGTGVHAHTLGGMVRTDTASHIHDNTANQYASRPTGAIAFASDPPETDSQGIANTTESPGTGGPNNNTSDGAGIAHGHGFGTGGPNNNTSDGSSTGVASGNLQPYRVVNWFIKA